MLNTTINRIAKHVRCLMIRMGAEDWVAQYRALNQTGDAVMELIAERNRVVGAGGEGMKVSSNSSLIITSNKGGVGWYCMLL